MKLQIFDMVDELLALEGGYSNNPNDAGGETIWGITHETALRNGYTGRMEDMPRTTAIAIYTQEYWMTPRFCILAPTSAAIAKEMFDTGVNMGTSTASRFLQEALNALNQQGELYPDVVVDGQVGAYTLKALRAHLQYRGEPGESVLLKALNCLQGARYIQLAKTRPQNEDFVYGWLLNRVVL